MARTLSLRLNGDWMRATRLLLVLGLMGFFGLFAGVLGASGRPELTAIFLGLLLALMIVSSRVAVLWFVIIGALVVTGLAQLYLPGSRYVRYVVPLVSLALLLHWIMDTLSTPSTPARDKDEALPSPIAWATAFAVTGIASVLVNLSSLDVTLVGTKNYFQMWGLLLGVAFVRWNNSLAKGLLWGLVLIALLQLPFAAHQYLFLVPKRIGLGEGIVPVDVVAGTFGAQLLGGGANAVLAAFLVIVIGWLLALWKNGVLSVITAVSLSLLLLTPLLVNQAKVAVLYLPLMFVVIFYRDIVARPAKFFVAGAGMFGVVAVLMTVLTLTNPTGRFQHWTELVEFVIERQTASIEERQGYSQLSRLSALTFWAKEHVTANPAHTLLGHGLGSSRETEGGIAQATTLAEQRYPGLNIGYTALSALLWDTGIVGLVTVLGMFGSAFFMAGWLARYYRGRDRFRTALFEGMQAAMAVLTLSLAHKDFFVVHLPFQAFVYLLIGYICHAWLQIVRGEGATKDEFGGV